MGKDINRIKVILVEKKRTNKWLAEQLGKDPATVSKWCTNTIQPSLDTLLKIAGLLNVQIQELVRMRRSLKVPWNPILTKDSTYPIQEEWNISNAM